MDAGALVVPVAILGGVGLLFGALIALANRFLRVFEDPRIDVACEMLPSANCGACGFAGCRAFAEALVAGRVEPAGCTVSSPDALADLAAFLGVDAGQARRRVARLLCSGGSFATAARAEYRGLGTCSAAAAVAGGARACAWGCLGLADCERACGFGAIRMNRWGLPEVDPARCTACGDCVDACPKDLFELLSTDDRLIVQCRNRLEGDAALEVCRVACTACGKCAVDAPPGVIDIRDGLAVVDRGKNRLCGPEATVRCPTGAIVWVEGAQRLSPRPEPRRSAVPC